MTHIPTPWRLNKFAFAHIVSVQGRGIASCGYSSNNKSYNKENQANAEFIVRACNSHDELYYAATELRRHLALFCGPDDAIANEIFRVADAALARAKATP